MMKVFTIGSTTAALLLAGTAQGVLIEDFQDYSEGDNLATEGPMDWDFDFASGTTGPPPTAVDPQSNGNLVGFFSNRGVGNNIQNDGTTWDEGDVVTLSFDFSAAGAVTPLDANIGLGVLQSEADLADGSDIAGTFRLDDGNLTVYNGAAFIDTGFDYAANTAYTVTVILDTAADTYDTFIDGGAFSNQQLADDFGLYRSASEAGLGLNAFIVRTNGGNNNPEGVSSLFIDNINAVPEPASLALVGLGGLCLLGRRRA